MDRQTTLKRLTSTSRVLRFPDSPVNSPINYPITRLPDYSIRGFTIIELLVVLALISILATIGMAQYRRGLTYAQEAVLKTDLFDMRDALDQYYADKGQYPVIARRAGHRWVHPEGACRSHHQRRRLAGRYLRPRSQQPDCYARCDGREERVRPDCPQRREVRGLVITRSTEIPSSRMRRSGLSLW